MVAGGFRPRYLARFAMTESKIVLARTIVVVPCYNEAQRLDLPAYGRFLHAVDDVSLLFVDDGSTDDTPLVLEKLRQSHPAQVATLRLSSNCGKAEAVRRGIRLAMRRHASIVGYWDADLATPLEAILQLRDVFAARPEVSLVMGSRVALLGRRIVRSNWRHLTGRSFATAASLVLKLPVYDTQCGAKLLRVTPKVRELFARPFRSRWIFDVELLARLVAGACGSAQGAAGQIYELPLDVWQDVRGSKLRPRDIAASAIDLVALWRRMLSGSELASGDLAHNPTGEMPKGTKHREAA